MKSLLLLLVSALISGVVEIWPLLEERLVMPRDLRIFSVEAKAPGQTESPCAGTKVCPIQRKAALKGPAQPELDAGLQVAVLSGEAWIPHRTSIDL